MSYPYDRFAQDPGGMECCECGTVFVGGEEHDQCAVCANNGWRPIDTANKGDELVLLSVIDWPPSTACSKPVPVKVGGWWDGSWHVFGASWTPTHWQPLPKPPVQP